MTIPFGKYKGNDISFFDIETNRKHLLFFSNYTYFTYCDCLDSWMECICYKTDTIKYVIKDSSQNILDSIDCDLDCDLDCEDKLKYILINRDLYIDIIGKKKILQLLLALKCGPFIDTVRAYILEKNICLHCNKSGVETVYFHDKCLHNLYMDTLL